MPKKNAEPDIVQSLRNMRDLLAQLLTEEQGDEWLVREGETPAQYAQRYLVHRGSHTVSEAATIPAGGTATVEVGPDAEPPTSRPDVLAHAIRNLYVRRKIEFIQRLQDAEHEAWRDVASIIERAVAASEAAMAGRGAIPGEQGRIPFMAEMAAVKSRIEAQFPGPAPGRRPRTPSDVREYRRVIAFAAERELHPTFGDAEISRMIIDGLPRDGRTPEARLRARLKRHANKRSSEGLQTTESWMVIIDDQE